MQLNRCFGVLVMTCLGAVFCLNILNDLCSSLPLRYMRQLRIYIALLLHVADMICKLLSIIYSSCQSLFGNTQCVQKKATTFVFLHNS